MLPRNCLLDGVGSTFSCRLQTLSVRVCSITSITTSNTSACNTDRLEYIDCSSCTCLISISISSNALTKVNPDGCVHLQNVSISSPVLQLIELPTASLTWIYLNCLSLKRIQFLGYVGNRPCAFVNCPSLESSSALLGDEFLNGDESTQLAYKKSRWGEIILALPAYAKWRGWERNIKWCIWKKNGECSIFRYCTRRYSDSNATSSKEEEPHSSSRYIMQEAFRTTLHNISIIMQRSLRLSPKWNESSLPSPFSSCQ